jgi:hypothetical protein
MEVQGLRHLSLNGNSVGLIGGQNMFSVMDRKGFDVFSVLLHGCNMDQVSRAKWRGPSCRCGAAMC